MDRKDELTMPQLTKTHKIILSVITIILIALSSISLYTYLNLPTVKVKKAIKLAQTDEKKESIRAIYNRMKVYGKHITSAETCAYLVLSTDRNEKIIETITTDYVLQPFGGTSSYVELAQFAAKAPLADKEFIEIAELMKKGNTQNLLSLGKKASLVKTQTEREILQHDIDQLK